MSLQIIKQLMDAADAATHICPKEKYNTLYAIAAQEISRLRGWIADEGARSDICTWNALGEVCTGCRCKNAPKEAKEAKEADSDGYIREDEDWFFSPNDGD